MAHLGAPVLVACRQTTLPAVARDSILMPVFQLNSMDVIYKSIVAVAEVKCSIIYRTYDGIIDSTSF